MRRKAKKGVKKMLINYKTKQDTNGNTYNLVVNHDKKEFSQMYGRVNFANLDIVSTKKNIRQLKELLIKDNYKEV